MLKIRRDLKVKSRNSTESLKNWLLNWFGLKNFPSEVEVISDRSEPECSWGFKRSWKEDSDLGYENERNEEVSKKKSFSLGQKDF